MKALLNHLWNNNRELALTKSVANCHSEGVHSVMLSDAPGAMVRMFFAAGTHHKLWKNTPGAMYRGLSVGFHPHHCALTLVPLLGRIENWIVIPSDNEGMPVTAYLFDSKLRGGRGGFRMVDRTYRDTFRINSVGVGEWEAMRATDVHTVFVDRGADAAWLVLEGPENPDYQPVCYSNRDLENEPTAHLYKPMDPDFIRRIMNLVL